MPKTITVNVTERDIQYGVPRDVFSCPIARSLRRHKEFKDLTFEVSKRLVTLAGYHPYWSDPRGMIARQPEVARKFIERFDLGEPVEPFTFKLEVAL